MERMAEQVGRTVTHEIGTLKAALEHLKSQLRREWKDDVSDFVESAKTDLSALVDS